MIDIEAIKAIQDEKPRKGPHRMSKSEKCEARRRYNAGQRRRRLNEYYRSVILGVDRRAWPPVRRISLGEEEVTHFLERIAKELKVPAEYLMGNLRVLEPAGPTTVTRENHD